MYRSQISILNYLDITVSWLDFLKYAYDFLFFAFFLTENHCDARNFSNDFSNPTLSHSYKFYNSRPSYVLIFQKICNKTHTLFTKIIQFCVHRMIRKQFYDKNGFKEIMEHFVHENIYHL